MVVSKKNTTTLDSDEDSDIAVEIKNTESMVLEASRQANLYTSGINLSDDIRDLQSTASNSDFVREDIDQDDEEDNLTGDGEILQDLQELAYEVYQPRTLFEALEAIPDNGSASIELDKIKSSNKKYIGVIRPKPKKSELPKQQVRTASMQIRNQKQKQNTQAQKINLEQIPELPKLPEIIPPSSTDNKPASSKSANPKDSQEEKPLPNKYTQKKYESHSQTNDTLFDPLDGLLPQPETEDDFEDDRSLLPPKPWERQPHESRKAFRAFQIHLHSGEKRSLKETSRKLGLESTRSCQMWSSGFNWKKRIDAYEDEKLHQKLKVEKSEHLEKIKELSLQRDQLAKLSYATSIQIMGKCLEVLKTFDAKKISVDALPNYLKTASTLAHLALESRTEALAIDKLIHTYNLDQKQKTEPVME